MGACGGWIIDGTTCLGRLRVRVARLGETGRRTRVWLCPSLLPPPSFAQSALAPVRVLVLDCAALAAVDYTGAVALLSACKDAEAGVAARIAGGGEGGDDVATCIVFLAGVAEAAGAGGVGPLLRRCGASLGLAVEQPPPEQLGVWSGAEWAVGSVRAYRDVDAALRAAAVSLARADSTASAAVDIAKSAGGYSDAVLELPLLKDDPPHVAGGGKPKERPREDAVEGFPPSSLARGWTRQRRGQEQLRQQGPTQDHTRQADGSGANAYAWSLTGTLDSLSRRGPAAWWLIAPVRLVWATLVLLSELIGSGEPGAPVLQVRARVLSAEPGPGAGICQ